MYERKIITTITDGGSSLPSVVYLSALTSYNVETTLTAGNTVQSIYPQKKELFAGNMGHDYTVNDKNKKYGYSEFGIEFYFSNYFSKNEIENNNIKDFKNKVNISQNNYVYDFYSKITDEYYTNFSSEYLNKNFIVIQIPDYSSQAMTIRNYDFTVKVFETIDSILYKIPNFYIAVLKSYTKKTAWILVSKTVCNDIKNINQIIIDFNYKQFKDEDINFLKYNTIYSKLNISDLYNSLSNVSPYLDKVYLSSSASIDNSTNLVLDKQSDYFKEQLKTVYDYPFKDGKSNNNNNTFNTMFARGNTEIIDSLQTNVLYCNKSIASNYYKNAYYEVYQLLSPGKYNDKDIYVSSRILKTDITDTFYEVFPMNTTQVHYIFRTASVNDEVSIDDLKAMLFANKYYLYNGVFSNMNIIIEKTTLETTKYVETYIPIQKSNNIESTTNPEESKVTFNEVEDIFNKSNMSSFDPAFYQAKPYDNETVIPYLAMDKYVDSVLTDGCVRIVDKKDTTNIFEFDENPNIIYNNSNIDISAKNTVASNENKINVNDENTDNYFRNIDLKYFNNKKAYMDSLSENLELLVPSENNIKKLSEISKDKTISLNNCLFVYIESDTPVLYVKYSYTDKVTTEECLYPYSHIDNDDETTTYKYIIIGSRYNSDEKRSVDIHFSKDTDNKYCVVY